MFIGSVTDPYLPQEEQYGRTRALLEQLKGSGAKITIAAKSGLILRDLELIRTFPESRVSWSVNTLDEYFKDDMDNAVSIERRLAAELKDYAAEIGLDYAINDDGMGRPFDAPPVIVNYFYRERIKKSAKKRRSRYAGIAGSRNDKTRN